MPPSDRATPPRPGRRFTVCDLLTTPDRVADPHGADRRLNTLCGSGYSPLDRGGDGRSGKPFVKSQRRFFVSHVVLQRLATSLPFGSLRLVLEQASSSRAQSRATAPTRRVRESVAKNAMNTGRVVTRAVECWCLMVETMNRVRLDKFTRDTWGKFDPKDLEVLKCAILRRRRVRAAPIRP